ncbi:MAG TPA: hypothetical protein PLE14_01115 [Anaerolineales bacterium]|nr:hypothetical protein [Anaerolineales bacterium]
MFNNLSDRAKNVLQIALVLGIVGAALAVLMSLGIFRSKSEDHFVKFEVSASGGFAVITLRTGDETIHARTTVSVPWSKSIRLQRGTQVYLTAANPTEIGEVSCRIFLDKSLWKEEKISNPKNGVACAGIVP